MFYYAKFRSASSTFFFLAIFFFEFFFLVIFFTIFKRNFHFEKIGVAPEMYTKSIEYDEDIACVRERCTFAQSERFHSRMALYTPYVFYRMTHCLDTTHRNHLWELRLHNRLICVVSGECSRLCSNHYFLWELSWIDQIYSDICKLFQ